MFRKIFLLLMLTLMVSRVFSWGFFAHQEVNRNAVFLLPPEMIAFYKTHIAFISEHAVDPDKRRYLLPSEGARHFIDIDHYGPFPFSSMPHAWKEAVATYSEDTLRKYGIVPWWIETMMSRLTYAFREKNAAHILKYSAELGHYIADAHVPLHASSNHNGQLTNQEGIHAFWESRIPELESNHWNFFLGHAAYIPNTLEFTWARILESAAAADTVLKTEYNLHDAYPESRRFAFEERKGKFVKQYSEAYTRAYNSKLGDMVERRMRASVFAIASYWYTAWINAGQPDLSSLLAPQFTKTNREEWMELNRAWNRQQEKGRSCSE